MGKSRLASWPAHCAVRSVSAAPLDGQPAGVGGGKDPAASLPRTWARQAAGARGAPAGWLSEGLPPARPPAAPTLGLPRPGGDGGAWQRGIWMRPPPPPGGLAPGDFISIPSDSPAPSRHAPLAGAARQSRARTLLSAGPGGRSAPGMRPAAAAEVGGPRRAPVPREPGGAGARGRGAGDWG